MRHEIPPDWIAWGVIAAIVIGLRILVWWLGGPACEGDCAGWTVAG